MWWWLCVIYVTLYGIIYGPGNSEDKRKIERAYYNFIECFISVAV